MAFIRKKGKSFYLVHNVRENGRVRQVHLACLGNRPRLGDDVVEQVRRLHPQMQIDWEAVRGRAAITFMSPFLDTESVQQLIRSMHNLELDLEELNLAMLRDRLRTKMAPGEADREVQELMQAMEELRAGLERKIKQQPVTLPSGMQSIHQDQRN